MPASNEARLPSFCARIIDIEAFVRMRLQLQQCMRDLTEAHELGRALEMVIATESLEIAAVALAASLRDLLMHKATIEQQIQASLYEYQALHEMIAKSFEICLHSSSLVSSSNVQDVSPAERYPWLRRFLGYYAARIDQVLRQEMTGNPTRSGELSP